MAARLGNARRRSVSLLVWACCAGLLAVARASRHPHEHDSSLAEASKTSALVFTVNELTYLRAREKENDVLQDMLKTGGDQSLDDQTWLSAKDYVRVWDVYGPNYNCLYSRERLGRTGDGGKWVCGPNMLLQSKSCVVYSFGCNGEVSFEEALLSTTQCEVHTFDHTLSEPAQASVRGVPGLHFHNVGLGVRQTSQEGQSPLLSLEHLMESLKHNWVDILKIDVEDAEWEIFKDFYSSGNASLPVTQLLIELHTSNPADGSMLQKIMDFFQRLLDDDYRIFSVEPNYYCLGGACAKDHLEYAMIKVSKAGHVVRPGVYIPKLNL